jgi:translation elongation factor EF-Tu-like GTPase
MRDLLSRLFPKRRANDADLPAEQRITNLENQVNQLRAVVGSILLRAEGSTRKSAFNIRGRGPIVTGKAEKGVIRIGDRVLLESANGSVPVTIVAVEMYQRTLDRAEAGDNVGLQLDGITHDQAQSAVLLRSQDA